MNKQQIAIPAVAVLIAITVVAIVHGRNQARYYVRAKSLEIGQSLIKETNSNLLVTIGPGLKDKLKYFLGSPAKIESVSLGDEQPPVGDGRASSELWLINELQERVVIRLQADPASEKFHILGYWTPPSASDDPKH